MSKEEEENKLIKQSQNLFKEKKMAKEEKKILNLFTKKNNIFTPAECVLCGNTFEPGEDIYLVDKEDNNSLVCDNCAKEDYKRGGVYKPIKEEDKYVYIKKEGKMKEEEEKELKELVEESLKALLTPKENFRDKSDKEIEDMQISMKRLARKLQLHDDLLSDIRNFKKILDSLNRKDDFETTFKIFSNRIHEDDLPF